MAARAKENSPSKDQWTSNLPIGLKAEYRSKQLAGGKYKISARIVGTNPSQSRIVDFPVSRSDVETVFLSDLIGSAS
jgi:hypothetical protein